MEKLTKKQAATLTRLATKGYKSLDGRTEKWIGYTCVRVEELVNEIHGKQYADLFEFHTGREFYSEPTPNEAYLEQLIYFCRKEELNDLRATMILLYVEIFGPEANL